MQKYYFLIVLFIGFFVNVIGQEKIIARQGQVSFFSYTSVENISA